MKTLLILRHGKAENRGKESATSDHPRQLTTRGRQEANEMGRVLAERGPAPDLILASDARRAYQTATLAAAELAAAPPVQPEPAIYDAGLDTLLAVIRDLPAGADCVLIVGHNPGLESLTVALSGEAVSLPTGGLVCITFPISSWHTARDGTGTLAWGAAPTGN